jgi:hypothetical protein
MLAEAIWRICGQRDQGLPQLFQARSGTGEARMVAVHDPTMVRNKTCCHAEGTGIFGEHNPALGHRSFEHAPVAGLGAGGRPGFRRLSALAAWRGPGSQGRSLAVLPRG